MKICIDAGHNYSKFDKGAKGYNLREQDITWYVADKLKRYLESLSHTVIMTRPKLTTNLGSNLSTSLSARYNMANTNNADYFISIHCNAGGGRGTETLIYKGGGMAEGLANSVQNEIVRYVGTIDRGIKVQNVAVLRETNMPAILVELAFIDTKTESEILKNKQDDFALAIANGFQRFIGGGQVMDEFKDLPKEHWAYSAITELRAMGVVNGDPNGNVRPDESATRAEVMMMLRNTIRYLTGK